MLRASTRGFAFRCTHDLAYLNSEALFIIGVENELAAEAHTLSTIFDLGRMVAGAVTSIFDPRHSPVPGLDKRATSSFKAALAAIVPGVEDDKSGEQLVVDLSSSDVTQLKRAWASVYGDPDSEEIQEELRLMHARMEAAKNRPATHGGSRTPDGFELM